MVLLSDDKRLLTYPLMNAHSEITCFTTTREGGCSEGNYRSFNCGIHTADNPENIKQNLHTLCSILPHKPITLVIPHQTHETNSLLIDERFALLAEDQRSALLEGKDILLTQQPGTCICITTADCTPLAFYDKKQRAVCVAHAGWRGTAQHIARRALEQMQQHFGSEPQDISAIIGPSISMAAFEVGEEVYDAFKKAEFPIEQVAEWKPRTHKYLINLWLANKIDMEAFGLKSSQIEMAGICTYRQYGQYFSARRLSIESGRMLTGIMLNA